MPPKTVKGFRLTAEMIQKAKQNNPPGVRVVEYGLKKSDFYKDQSLVAGYLKNCANTEKLRELVGSLDHLFDEYAVLRMNGWTSKVIPNVEDPGNPSSSALFTFLHRLRNNHAAAKLLNSVSTEPDETKVCSVFDVADCKHINDITGYIITTNILIKIVQQAHMHFEHGYVFDPENEVLMPDSEDLHRAYALLRIWSRMNEEGRKSKAVGKATKVQNNVAKPVHYIPKVDEETDNMDTSEDALGINAALLEFEPPSEPPSEFEEVDTEDIISLLEKCLNTVDEKEIADLERENACLPPLTLLEQASLEKYASDHLDIRYDKWAKIGIDENASEEDPNEAIKGIIKEVHNAAKRKEKYAAAKIAEKAKDSDEGREEGYEEDGDDDFDEEADIEETLDHASMKTHSSSQAAEYLGLDINNPALFPGLQSSLVLLLHQLIGVSTMFDREKISFDLVTKGKPTLQANILADDMGLGKTLQILALTYFAHKMGIQSTGERVAPPGPTLICIPPGVALGWYQDYNRFFSNHLKMFFVGSSFRRGGDPLYQACCIDQVTFEDAVLNPENSPVFKNPDDVGRTIFMVSHYTLNRFTVTKKVEREEMLSQDNIAPASSPTHEFQTEKKRIRTPKKSGPEQTSPEYEEEDETLVQEGNAFETFLINFSSRFSGKFYRVVLDEGHAVRHPESGISRATKLLKPWYTWIVSATPLLNKTRDFYGYSHIMYDIHWDLDVTEPFTDLGTLEKFEKAQTADEILELFNPRNIRRLATNGHIDVTVAAVTIPILLRECMIRRTKETVIDGNRIGDAIPKKHVNAVVLAFNKAEQMEYCHLHQKYTAQPLGQTVGTKEGNLDGAMDARRVKALLCASVSPRFAVLHRRIGYAQTKAAKLKNITGKPFGGLSYFLKNTHEASDYQYHVPSTRLDRAIELLNMSPTIRYICRILYTVVTTGKKRLTFYAQTPNVAWLVYMFCLNWGCQTAWLRSSLTHNERDRIVSDFNNPNGRLTVLVSTHTVGGFGINLQLSGCHHMVVVELPRNLNTLLQTEARLLRIGQKFEVYIWTIFVDHTFQRWWCSNLARKAISDLGAQLGGKLKDDQKADISTIDEHAEKALNVIMGWNKNRSH